MEVEIYRNASEEADVQYTTARFHIPLITPSVDELNLCNINAQFTEKIDGFSGQNIGLSISQIKYLRLCWGSYRSPMEGSFIPTPKWISPKHAIVNV